MAASGDEEVPERFFPHLHAICLQRSWSASASCREAFLATRSAAAAATAVLTAALRDQAVSSAAKCYIPDARAALEKLAADLADLMVEANTSNNSHTAAAAAGIAREPAKRTNVSAATALLSPAGNTSGPTASSRVPSRRDILLGNASAAGGGAAPGPGRLADIVENFLTQHLVPPQSVSADFCNWLFT